MDELARKYHRSQNFLYLGRGINYPIALEGALKLKEISYIHAEGYPAGEMKHGPIALIDEHMPVVAIATGDELTEKTKSNMQEVKARDGIVIALTDRGPEDFGGITDELIQVPSVSPLLSREGIAALAVDLGGGGAHSTVTLFARFRGWSTSAPRRTPMK